MAEPRISTTTPKADPALPASLMLTNINPEAALLALADQLRDLAATSMMPPLSDIEVSLTIDRQHDRASLHFRCCR